MVHTARKAVPQSRVTLGSMTTHASDVARGAIVLVLLLMLSACANMPRSMPPTTHPDSDSHGASQSSWHFIRFRLGFDADGRTQSYLDGLIADQVIAPALQSQRPAIELWRFHRRWPRDDIGHLFSFIYLASPATSAALDAQIDRSPIVNRLREDGLLLEIRRQRIESGDPGATSDPTWPIEIQHHWPTLIMGASQMWLDLVKQAAAARQQMPLYERYAAVESRIDRLWITQADHAFFHHLSALFGYRPVQRQNGDIETF